jgi:hypothetical protein
MLDKSTNSRYVIIGALFDKCPAIRPGRCLLVKPFKRIWELRPAKVCKEVGKALTLKELQQIARKFDISPEDPRVDEDFAPRTTMVRLISQDNSVSRLTEKLIGKRFLIRREGVSLDDPAETVESLGKSPHDSRVPLRSIVWKTAARSLCGGICGGSGGP